MLYYLLKILYIFKQFNKLFENVKTLKQQQNFLKLTLKEK